MATKRTLCRDIYEIGKSGTLTASLGAICAATSAASEVGVYAVLDRLLLNGNRLTDEAILLTIVLGIVGLASGVGTKFAYNSTKRDYNLLKEDFKEYSSRQ